MTEKVVRSTDQDYEMASFIDERFEDEGLGA